MFAYQTHTRRILIKPSFQSYDRQHKTTVTSRQFQSTLSSLYPTMNLSKHDLELVSLMYAIPGVGVNYLKFCQDIHARETLLQTQSVQQREPNPAFAPLATKPLPARSNDDCSVNEILNEIRILVANKRINVDDIFKDFDRHNKGHISRDQFNRCLTIRHILLRPQQQQKLVQAFAVPTEPSHVDYLRFISELHPKPF